MGQAPKLDGFDPNGSKQVTEGVANGVRRVGRRRGRRGFGRDKCCTLVPYFKT